MLSIKEKLKSFSSYMFAKGFMEIFNSSISAKINSDTFLINERNPNFNDLQEFVKLSFTKNYSWEKASLQADIHKNIYENISDAKFICHTMPSYTLAYSLEKDNIEALDYFGMKSLAKLNIIKTKDYNHSFEKSSIEISKSFIEHNTDILIIRGYGVYSYHRNLEELVKKISILEKSCQILSIKNKI